MSNSQKKWASKDQIQYIAADVGIATRSYIDNVATISFRSAVDLIYSMQILMQE